MCVCVVGVCVWCECVWECVCICGVCEWCVCEGVWCVLVVCVRVKVFV